MAMTSASKTPTILASEQQQQLKQQQHESASSSSSSSLSLQTLVALASTLFDQAAAAEKAKELSQQIAQETEAEHDEQPRHHQQYSLSESRDALQSKPQTTNAAEGQKRKTLATASPTTTTKCQEPVPSRIRAVSKISNTNNNNSNIPNKPFRIQQFNFQCCTREGFLSRLRSVLDDVSRSNVLSWMPDGKSFTIVSSRKFAKSGLIYEWFGIKKMSSFLRRLNQLGFCRVRDPTDPKNLDVFRKPGFCASSSTEGAASMTTSSQQSTRVSNNNTTTKAVQHLDSPTSTLQFSSTMTTKHNKTEEAVPRNPLVLLSSESSSDSIASRASSPVDSSSSVSTTTEMQPRSSNDSIASSSSNTPSSWLCSTPMAGNLFQQPQPPSGMGRVLSIPPMGGAQNAAQPLPLALPLMPPPQMPASPNGGPVLLQARSEIFDASISPPPPPPSSSLGAHQYPLNLSPKTLSKLEIPHLQHPSSKGKQQQHSVDTEKIRPPPMEFVSECIRQMVNPPSSSSEPPLPMEIEAAVRNGEPENHQQRMDVDTRPPSPVLGRIHIQQFPKMQHRREYLRLYQAAEDEANAILNGSSSAERQGRTSSSSSRLASNSRDFGLPACEASVLAHVELLQAYRGKEEPCQVTTE